MGTGSFPGVKNGRDVTLTPHPPSSAVGHERVELYLYSPCGPYSLYRASVPVQGCTLPYSRAIPLLPLWAVRPVQSLSACTRVTFTLPYLKKGEFCWFILYIGGSLFIRIIDICLPEYTVSTHKIKQEVWRRRHMEVQGQCISCVNLRREIFSET